jgi:hypothetical protein
MQIFLKLLAISLLLTSCTGAYKSKPSKASANEATNQTSKNISDHVVDVGNKVAIDAAGVPTDLRPYTNP